jgi:hypothetical protein
VTTSTCADGFPDFSSFWDILPAKPSFGEAFLSSSLASTRLSACAPAGEFERGSICESDQAKAPAASFDPSGAQLSAGLPLPVLGSRHFLAGTCATNDVESPRFVARPGRPHREPDGQNGGHT